MKVDVMLQNGELAASDGSTIRDDAFLPWRDSSVELLCFPETLAQVRMDQLYMLLSEARRVVKKDGVLQIRGPAPSRVPWKGVIHSLIGSASRLVFPEHYLSPEHWEEISRTETPKGLITQLSADYRRTSFPA